MNLRFKYTFALLTVFSLISSIVRGQTDSILISDISIDTLGNLKWKVTSYRTFEGQVEQFKAGKWIVIERIGRWPSLVVRTKDGVPIKKVKTSTYKKEVEWGSASVKFHKGINKYRIVITKPSPHIYTEVILDALRSNDDGSVWIVNNEIIMNVVEYYEIMDQDTKTILKGEAKKINIATLPKGAYFLYTKKATKTFTK